MNRDELYGVIMSLDYAINTLRNKFYESLDEDDFDKPITTDEFLDEAIQIVDTAALELSRCHSGYHPTRSPLRTFDDMENHGD